MTGKQLLEYSNQTKWKRKPVWNFRRIAAELWQGSFWANKRTTKLCQRPR